MDKACPFCGKEPFSIQYENDIRVGCSNRECPIFDSQMTSEEKWNKRPEEDRLHQELFDTKTNMAKQILELQTELFVEREKRLAFQESWHKYPPAEEVKQ
jgi:hypothetical protein